MDKSWFCWYSNNIFLWINHHVCYGSTSTFLDCTSTWSCFAGWKNTFWSSILGALGIDKPPIFNDFNGYIPICPVISPNVCWENHHCCWENLNFTWKTPHFSGKSRPGPVLRPGVTPTLQQRIVSGRPRQQHWGQLASAWEVENFCENFWPFALPSGNLT